MSMDISRRTVRRRLTWAVPALTVGAVVATAVVATSAFSSPNPRLPARTVQQLLVAVQSSLNSNASGTVVEVARLGLPSLPGASGGASLSWQSLLTGSHTAQVWMAGPDKQRVALKGSLSEADVIHNGQDLWTYTSDTNAVSHTVLAKDNSSTVGSTTDARAYTPAAAAQAVLKAIDPTTVVSLDSTRRVAGRKAYTLVLTPRDTSSTVSRVTIAIDSVHSVPLQVQVFGAGSTPAFETGFSEGVSFAVPKAALFDFHAPRGATVVQDPFGLRHHRGHGKQQERSPGHQQSSASQPKILGTGWTSIVDFPSGLPAGSTNAMISKLTTPVGTTGNRLLRTSLVNALFCGDGRVFLGAVSAAMLEKTAATTPR